MTLVCGIELRARSFGLCRDASVRDLTVVVSVQGIWEDCKVVNLGWKADLLFIMHCFCTVRDFLKVKHLQDI